MISIRVSPLPGISVTIPVLILETGLKCLSSLTLGYRAAEHRCEPELASRPRTTVSATLPWKGAVSPTPSEASLGPLLGLPFPRFLVCLAS